MRLAVVFDEIMETQGRKNVWLADLLATSPGTVTRLRSGDIAIDFDWSRKIEHALGLEAGELLRKAGYFEDPPMAAKGGAKPRRGTKVTKPRPPAN